MIGIAWTRVLPMSICPHIALTVLAPAPMSRRPVVAAAWGGHGLVARWRRSGVDVNLETGRGRTRQRCCNDAEGTGGDQCGNESLFREHDSSPRMGEKIPHYDCWIRGLQRSFRQNYCKV